MSVPRRYSDLALFRRLLRHAKPYWPYLAASLVLSLLSAPLALLMPLPLKIAVDSVIGSQPLPAFLAALLPTSAIRSPATLLTVVAALVVGVTFMRYLQTLASWSLQTYTGEQLLLDFRAQLFRHVQRLSLSYHDRKGVADSIYRIQYDAPSIRHIAIDGSIPVVTAACTLGAMIYVTARLDWQLALVALAVSPVLVLLSQICRRRLRTAWSEAKELQSAAATVVQEALGAIRVVKAFGREDHEQERFRGRSTRGMRAEMHVTLLKGGSDLLVGVIIAVGTAAALVVGVIHVQQGSLTLGELLIVVAYLAQMTIPLETLSNKTTDVQASLAGAERAFSLLDEDPDVAERPNARPLARASGAVAVRNVSFSYDGSHAVLHEISFEVGPTTRVGIVGATGAGKTTLISLLTRCHDPTAGQILLDGVDLRDYRLADLRNQFGIVLQEPVLFSTSIAENIAYAHPAASYREIVEAARAANAHDFIMRLPEAYQTQVGERGMCLSGGERQRISLARAFLKDAPILVLDEPTSAVDVRTEAAIMEAMERLMRRRTTFLITHRSSLLETCDVQLEIGQARLVSLTPVLPRGTGVRDAVMAVQHG